MFRQHFAGFLDRFDQRVIELFVLEMRAHGIDQALPKLFAALFVNRFVANDRELVRARRHENQNGVAFSRSVHTELMESFGRGGERIAVQFPALHINTNLPRCFRFCVSDRSNDTIVLEFTEEFFRPHDVTSSSLRPLHQSFRRRREIR
jgi:hypothetical protein